MEGLTGYTPFDNILKKTKNVVLFQEQYMQVLNDIFGFDLKYANDVRKILSKKKKDQLLVLEPEIREAGKKNNVPDHVVDFFWKSALASADYSFCLSHAASYSVLAAQMVYLKFKYPQSFYLHALKEAVTKPKPFDEIFEITQELPNFDIKLLPPDIDKSGLSFEKEGKDIRFGLGDIKGISSKSLENLKKFIKEDKKHKFAVFQAGKNAGINIGQMTALIYVGALDSVSFGTERRMLALECAGWYQLKEGEQAWLLNHGEKYNYSFKEAYLDIDNWVGSNGKKVARATRNNTISKGLETYRQIYLANKNNKRFAHWKFERDLLGYSYSFRLKDVFETGEVINDVKFAVSQFEGDNSSILGEVQEVKKFTSRNGNTCLKLVVCDELAKIQAMLVGDAEYESFKEQGLIPKAGDIIVLHGKKGTDDMIWIDKMSIQDVHVVFKKSDLTKQLNKETV